MQYAGLNLMWIESDLLGGNTTEHVMAGEDYAKAKGTHYHTITIQAMWQLLRQQQVNYIQEHDDDLRRRLLSLVHLDTTTENDEPVTLLTMETFREHQSTFVEMNNGRNPNLYFWWQYMLMVGVLLMFIRDGNWYLHLYSFGHMLPYFLLDMIIPTIPDGESLLCIAHINQLPVEVRPKFQHGYYVVKGSYGRFNQVDPGHSEEWLNGARKRAGGIVGITKTLSTLNRWDVTYNLRSQIAAATRKMFALGLDDQMTRNESIPVRIRRDHNNEFKLCSVYRDSKYLAPTHPLTLSTKMDLATEDNH